IAHAVEAEAAGCGYREHLRPGVVRGVVLPRSIYRRTAEEARAKTAVGDEDTASGVIDHAHTHRCWDAAGGQQVGPIATVQAPRLIGRATREAERIAVVDQRAASEGVVCHAVASATGG